MINKTLLNVNDVKISINGKLIDEFANGDSVIFFTETLREHEDGTGFTLTTKDASSAFSMAEKMAFSGKKYSIKLGKQRGSDWVLVVNEVAG